MKKTTLVLAALIAGASLPAAAPTPVAARVRYSGHVQVGITGNFASPDDRQNFGRLFDDRANEPLLNQFVLTAERALDPAATGFDWGFKLQGLYGSDARFIHSLGLLDRTTARILQPDIVEACLNLHLPVSATAGGIDVKVGKFVTLEGAEVIDNTGNIFYSHTYSFNFGIPFNHSGVLATIHATGNLDVMAGVTRGVNTSLKDNNDRPAFHGGLGFLNLAGGRLTVVATTHFGPETPGDNRRYRYLNALVAICRINDQLTSTSDLNYIYDDLARAKGYGWAQYFTYAVSAAVTASFRGEIWRDQNGFYAAQFGNNTDVMRFLRGGAFTPDPRTVGGGATTYGALTVGATVKTGLAGLVVRPEVRWDASLNGTRPFNDSQDGRMLTFAVDATISF
ncbi:MAG: porin [Opitutae bacterium]|nr:porin [Opitutae bacterium]